MAWAIAPLLAVPSFAQTAPSTAPAVTSAPPPRAWIVVDANSGRVIDAGNEREPLRPASTTKILTALAAVARLGPDSPIPVSARAEGMPARKINMKAGQVWDLEDTLHALLLSSANDAAVALAEAIDGRAEDFRHTLDALAVELRMADRPLLVDPSGLDDEFSIDGGNLISARDIAIAARALLREPRLAPIVATPVYQFTGGDGIVHRLGNHNRLLESYPGAIGMKTGYTKRSGHCLVAAATRDGRTLVAVVLDAVDTYGSATSLLERGFSGAAGTGDVLPPVPGPGTVTALDPPIAQLEQSARDTAGSAALLSAPADASDDPWWRLPLVVTGATAGLAATLRARVRLRRWRRRRRYRSARVRPSVHRPRNAALTTEYVPRPDGASRFHEVVTRDGQRRRG